MERKMREAGIRGSGEVPVAVGTPARKPEAGVRGHDYRSAIAVATAVVPASGHRTPETPLTKWCGACSPATVQPSPSAPIREELRRLHL